MYKAIFKNIKCDRRIFTLNECLVEIFSATTEFVTCIISTKNTFYT